MHCCIESKHNNIKWIKLNNDSGARTSLREILIRIRKKGLKYKQ